MHKSRDLDDEALLRRIAAYAVKESRSTAVMLSDIAEAEVRQLHIRKGYDSMTAYCVEVVHLSESAARKRVHAARIARKFPVLLRAVAEGRLHLTAVRMLSPHLNRANVRELIREAAHKSEREIERMLARPSPQPEVMRLDDGISPQVVVAQGQDAEGRAARLTGPLPESQGKVAPVSITRFKLETSIDAETEDDLRAVQALLGHSVPGCDVAQALKRSLRHMRRHLEKQKFAQVERPRESRSPSDLRTIPANVKRAVFERDGGRCAFIGDERHRCGSRDQLEFDHVLPIALGGQSTIENVRLVCRAHNQYEADRKLGREFMEGKRDAATRQVASGLRNLGMKPAEAREFAAATDPDGTIEDRLRQALRNVRVRGTVRGVETAAEETLVPV